MPKQTEWPAIIDDALVERMIPAIQQAIVSTTLDGGSRSAEGHVVVSAPDVASVLLMVLATILEPAPSCATTQGIRLTAELAGKELAKLIRDTRRLKVADLADNGSIH